MWGLKTITVPAVIGALGVVKKGIEKHIDKIPEKFNITELQKIKPHPLKSSIDRMKTMNTHWSPRTWIRDLALRVNMTEESRRILMITRLLMIII